MSSLMEWATENNTAVVRPYVSEDMEGGGILYGDPYVIECSWAAKAEQRRDANGTTSAIGPTSASSPSRSSAASTLTSPAESASTTLAFAASLTSTSWERPGGGSSPDVARRRNGSHASHDPAEKQGSGPVSIPSPALRHREMRCLPLGPLGGTAAA